MDSEQNCCYCCSVVVSGSLRPHGLQRAGLPCPSLSPRVCSNSYALSQWRHPTISPCHPLLLLPSAFPSIRVFSNESAFLIRWPKYWSFSFSIIPSSDIQDWFPLRLTGSISLLSKGLSSLLQNHSLKASILWHSAFFMVQFSHLYMTTGKAIALTIWTFVSKVISHTF